MGDAMAKDAEEEAVREAVRGLKPLGATVYEDGAAQYFQVRNGKQYEQNEERRQQLGGASSRIFEGVVVFVNGHSEPPATTLKDLVLRGGGDFAHVPFDARITHTLANTVAAFKAEKLRGRRPHSAPYLRPAWVVDSSAAGRRLPEAPYLLELAARDPGQQQLAGMLGAAPASPPVRSGPLSSHDNPNFLRDYFAQSRLAFIGDWRTRFERLLTDQGCSALLVAPSHAAGAERCVLHCDMDCFFVSVLRIRSPALVGVPVAVAHSASLQGTSEVSACSYEARQAGVRASMCVGDALRLCPPLRVCPYDFQAFAEASDALFTTLLAFSKRMQPVSVDEAYLDATGLGDPEQLAARIRAAVLHATGGCSVSVGIGPNKLLAKMATRAAKPDGVHRVRAQDAAAFLAPLPARQLHGLGRSAESSLEGLGIDTIGQLAATPLPDLRRCFGDAKGATLHAASCGRDDSEVRYEAARSVSVTCNWGMRPESAQEAHALLYGLASELCARLRAKGRRGRGLTLSAKRSRDICVPPGKFLGCGDCDDLSTKQQLGTATDDETTVARLAVPMLTSLSIPPDHLRGLGLSMGGLDVAPCDAPHAAGHGGAQPSVADAWRAAETTPKKRARVEEKEEEEGDGAGPLNQGEPLFADVEYAGLTSLGEMDPDVLAELPPAVRRDIRHAAHVAHVAHVAHAAPAAVAAPPVLAPADLLKWGRVDADWYGALPPEMQRDELDRLQRDMQHELKNKRQVESLKKEQADKGGAARRKVKARKGTTPPAKAVVPARPPAAPPSAPAPKAMPPELRPLAEHKQQLQELVSGAAQAHSAGDAAAGNAGLNAASALVLSSCRQCLCGLNCDWAWRFLRFARLLAHRVPAWAPACERAVQAAQAEVQDWIEERMRLTCAEQGAPAVHLGAMW